MCDVESYCYLPLLEELNYIPQHKYSFAPEILEHSRRIARHYRLYDNALLQTAITGMQWNEAEQRWIITTHRGDRFKARYVAMANGPLSKPKLPGIPGINEFRGHTFHTSRWDYQYTGGDSFGNLTNLKDKRIGIIGTGATAVRLCWGSAQTLHRQFQFFRECTPGYYNSEGATGNKQGFFSETYGAGSLRYFEVLAAWRNAGNLPFASFGSTGKVTRRPGTM